MLGVYLAHSQHELRPRHLELEEVEQLGERVRFATVGERPQLFLTIRTPPGRIESVWNLRKRALHRSPAHSPSEPDDVREEDVERRTTLPSGLQAP